MQPIERDPGSLAKRPAARRLHIPLLCLLTLTLYNANFRTIHIDDSVPASVLPFSLVLDHSFYIDRWVAPYLPAARGIYGAYFAVRTKRGLTSRYPVILPVVLTPLYVAPSWWIGHHQPPLHPGDPVTLDVINTMEKISASLIAMLSTLVLFLALRKVLSSDGSFLLALLYALASNTWTISSQALWRHGLAELCFTFLLWALLSGGEFEPLWVGLALALAIASKPPDFVMAAPFVLYYLFRGLRRLSLFAAPMLLLGAFTLAYNWRYTGHLLGSYAQWVAAGPNGSAMLVRNPFWVGFAGLLVSPSRGLLIYTPWAIFGIWGAIRLWRQNTYPWSRYLIASAVLLFLGYAKAPGWWGGWCFGPRYLTDLMPFLTFFLVPILPRISRSRWLRAAFATAVVLSLAVQVIGAFYYRPRLNSWDETPVNVDLAPQRLWDWRDTQLSRSVAAGPAPPDLYYDWFLR